MNGLIMTAQLLLSLTILVVLHEFGHFITARLFKMRVEKFYLFFDFLFPLGNVLKFSLFKIKKGDTEYGIGWFPLGGYVNISGMIDESMNTDQMKSEPQPWEFRSKPAWQRLIVILGGVIVNVILGIIIFTSIMHVYGEKKTPLAEVNKLGIHAGDFAKEVGFTEGDKIVSMNGTSLKYFEEIFESKNIMADEVYFDVERNGEVKRIQMTHDFIARLSKSKAEFISPINISVVEQLSDKLTNAKDAGVQVNDRIIGGGDTTLMYFHELQAYLKNHAGQKVTLKIVRNTSDTLQIPVAVDGEGRIGFQPAYNSIFHVDTITYSWGSAVPKGFGVAYQTFADQLSGLKKIFTGRIKAQDALSGPIGIAQAFGGHWNWEWFWRLTGLISLVLAIMNLLPIPGLDGGYAIFILWELFTGRKVSDTVMTRALNIGLIIILLLTFFALGNDIFKIFKK